MVDCRQFSNSLEAMFVQGPFADVINAELCVLGLER
jgi:hypothetical protein